MTNPRHAMQKNTHCPQNKRPASALLNSVSAYAHQKYLRTALLTASLILAACAAPPVATPDRDISALTIPAAWMNAHADAQQQHNDHWWQNYRDDDLNRLMQQAFAHNHSLADAALNWRQALLAVDSALARQMPQYSGDINARASRDIKRQDNSHSFAATFTASYQLDLWRKLDAQKESARFTADAGGEDYLAARLALSGQIAKTYFQLRYLDEQLAWNTRFRDNRRARLNRSRAQLAAGSLSELDVLRETRSLTALEREHQTLDGERRKAANSLSLLLGSPPQALSFPPKALDDLAIPDIPAGLPAHLLAQRPDLRAAQYRLQAALADIAVAERDFYPDLSLSGSLGSSSTSLIRLLQNPAASLGAAISLPFLQYHDKEIALLSNQLRYEKSLADFRRTLYQAIADVENALINNEQLRAEADILKRELAEQRKIETLTDIRYQAGADALQDYLDAKNNREQAQSALLTNRLNRLNASIDLYLALGGNTHLP